MTAAPQSTRPALPPLPEPKSLPISSFFNACGLPAHRLQDMTGSEARAVSIAECKRYASERDRQIVELCAAVCIEQGRKDYDIDSEAFYIATGQCAAALLALLDGEAK